MHSAQQIFSANKSEALRIFGIETPILNTIIYTTIAIE